MLVALASLTWGLHPHMRFMGPGAPFKLRPGQATTPWLSYKCPVLGSVADLVSCLDLAAR